MLHVCFSGSEEPGHLLVSSFRDPLLTLMDQCAVSRQKLRADPASMWAGSPGGARGQTGVRREVNRRPCWRSPAAQQGSPQGGSPVETLPQQTFFSSRHTNPIVENGQSHPCQKVIQEVTCPSCGRCDASVQHFPAFALMWFTCRSGRCSPKRSTRTRLTTGSWRGAVAASGSPFDAWGKAPPLCCSRSSRR